MEFVIELEMEWSGRTLSGAQVGGHPPGSVGGPPSGAGSVLRVVLCGPQGWRLGGVQWGGVICVRWRGVACNVKHSQRVLSNFKHKLLSLSIQIPYYIFYPYQFFPGYIFHSGPDYKPWM